MKTVNLDSVIDTLAKQARREQDLSLIERDTAYFNHALNYLMLTGSLQFIQVLKERGARLELPEDAAKELGFDVAS